MGTGKKKGGEGQHTTPPQKQNPCYFLFYLPVLYTNILNLGNEWFYHNNLCHLIITQNRSSGIYYTPVVLSQVLEMTMLHLFLIAIARKKN